MKKVEEEAYSQKGAMRSHDFLEVFDFTLDQVLADPTDIAKIEEQLGHILTEPFVDYPRETQRTWLSTALSVPPHYVPVIPVPAD
jgi:hypothetical protein